MLVVIMCNHGSDKGAEESKGDCKLHGEVGLRGLLQCG